MDTEKKHPRVGVGVLVLQNNKILLGKRKNSHGDGLWAPPGGHLEFGEDVETCAKRELEEEAGLVATKVRRGTWVNNFFHTENKHYITLLMFVDAFDGKPELKEPDKCEGWEWFSMNALPEKLFPPLKVFFDIEEN